MTLEQCRHKIDQIDYHIHDLLNERAKISLEVAKAKAQNGGGPQSVICPEREQQIYSAVKAYNKGPYSDEAIAAIFKQIIHFSIELQCDYLAKNQD